MVYWVNNKITIRDSFEISQTSNTSTSIDDNPFHLSPNGEVHFVKPIQKPSVLKIYNVLGYELYSEKVSSGKQTIFFAGQ